MVVIYVLLGCVFMSLCPLMASTNEFEENFMTSSSTGSFKSVLDDMTQSLSPFDRAEEMTKRMMEAGFKWDDLAQVANKVSEELNEVEECLTNNTGHLREEIGDLLLSSSSLCVYLGITPQQAFDNACLKACASGTVKSNAVKGYLLKIDKELSQIKASLPNGEKNVLAEGMGNILLSGYELSIIRGIVPEQALTEALKKFENRFRFVERDFFTRGKSMQNATLKEILEAWKRAKEQ